MRFLCLGYYDRAMDLEKPAVIEAALRECGPYLEEFRRSGKVILDAGLEKRSATVRSVGGKVTITDGPFTELKEVVGGVSVIEATDLADALRVASLHPAARMGERFGWRMEVRPLASYETRETLAAPRGPAE